MSIVNRRNAVIGWIVVKFGKRAARKKAQGAVPTRGAAAGGALATLGGVLLFWRKKKRGAGTE
jgi:LPXTG-motif cell wall-anchored protein